MNDGNKQDYQFGGNGQGDIEATGDGMKKLDEFLSHGTFDKMFTFQEMVSAIRMLVDPGDSLRGLWMRGDFASKRKDGHRHVLALARHIAKCREFQDANAEEEALDVVAGYTSIDGTRVKLLVEAITGSKPEKPSSVGWQDRVKKAAGLESVVQ